MAMECFFIEWFGTSEDNPWGRQPVSNATEAIERAIREAQAWNPFMALQGKECSLFRSQGSELQQAYVCPEAGPLSRLAAAGRAAQGCVLQASCVLSLYSGQHAGTRV